MGMEVVISSPLMAYLLDGAVYDQVSDAEGLLFGRKQSRHKATQITDGPSAPSNASEPKTDRFLIEYFVVLGRRWSFYDRGGSVDAEKFAKLVADNTHKGTANVLGWFRTMRGRNITEIGQLTKSVCASLSTLLDQDSRLPLCLLLTDSHCSEPTHSADHHLCHYDSKERSLVATPLLIENLQSTVCAEDFWPYDDNERASVASDAVRANTKHLVDTAEQQLSDFAKSAIDLAHTLEHGKVAAKEETADEASPNSTDTLRGAKKIPLVRNWHNVRNFRGRFSKVVRGTAERSGVTTAATDDALPNPIGTLGLSVAETTRSHRKPTAAVKAQRGAAAAAASRGRGLLAMANDDGVGLGKGDQLGDEHETSEPESSVRRSNSSL